MSEDKQGTICHLATKLAQASAKYQPSDDHLDEDEDFDEKDPFAEDESDLRDLIQKTSSPGPTRQPSEEADEHVPIDNIPRPVILKPYEVYLQDLDQGVQACLKSALYHFSGRLVQYYNDDYPNVGHAWFYKIGDEEEDVIITSLDYQTFIQKLDSIYVDDDDGDVGVSERVAIRWVDLRSKEWLNPDRRSRIEKELELQGKSLDDFLAMEIPDDDEDDDAEQGAGAEGGDNEETNSRRSGDEELNGQEKEAPQLRPGSITPL